MTQPPTEATSSPATAWPTAQTTQGRHGGSPGLERDAGPGRKRAGKGGGKGGAEQVMVPDAEFTSYYGRPIVKAAPWEHDIAYYLFTGGVAAGSSMLAAGADLTGRPALRRVSRMGSLGGLLASMVFLVHDLGKPSRFLNMLRVAKLTSPMSVGTWILSIHAPLAALASMAELVGMLPARWQPAPVRLLLALGRPAGLAGALTAPPVAAYTAVLLADTATPAWHSAHEELPFVFCGSAAAASGGLGLIGAPLAESGPARAFAVGGALVELAAERRMERSMGISAETLHQGEAGRWMRKSVMLTAGGAVGAVVGRRSRVLSALSGAALMAGSFSTRMGVFEAGLASANDPKYTVVPQRERLARGEPVRYGE